MRRQHFRQDLKRHTTAGAAVLRHLLLLRRLPCLLLQRQHSRPIQHHKQEEEPFERWNVQVITGDDAGRIVGLIHDLLVQTVQKAASTAPLRFATGAMDSGTNFPTVHSLAQCTPDLPAGDCLACLQRLVGMIDSTVALRVGAQIHVMRCFFRYEAYPFYDGQPMLRINGSLSPAPAPAPTTATKHKSKLWVIPVVVVPLVAAASLCFVFYSPCFKRYRKGKAMRLQAGSRRTQGEDELVLDGKNSDFSVFDFEQILDATDHFSEENKLGQGGFGAVYKGHFPDGLEIAIKRLASHSGQGFAEFRNEVQLIAKLQHRNLVRLLGVALRKRRKYWSMNTCPTKAWTSSSSTKIKEL
ncbi:cysteine-rich receptor-like protein kinase 15 [Panicum miliaceum]|uniref:Cysteine-rich receptor-like protein kinase 15 n=1 Tax=Panicum miliaceum TaxID=4540 RepID=A0A3L6Q5A0_PANMI|nr:cysteine-rich receptor-like protein kinase 15 [Panicum miliaceum]